MVSPDSFMILTSWHREFNYYGHLRAFISTLITRFNRANEVLPIASGHIFCEKFRCEISPWSQSRLKQEDKNKTGYVNTLLKHSASGWRTVCNYIADRRVAYPFPIICSPHSLTHNCDSTVTQGWSVMCDCIFFLLHLNSACCERAMSLIPKRLLVFICTAT